LRAYLPDFPASNIPQGARERVADDPLTFKPCAVTLRGEEKWQAAGCWKRLVAEESDKP
jgi:hypothetical protein